jgi:hypothetical protein
LSNFLTLKRADRNFGEFIVAVDAIESVTPNPSEYAHQRTWEACITTKSGEKHHTRLTVEAGGNLIVEAARGEA